MTWWLPAILASLKPWRSRARTTRVPETDCVFFVKPNILMLYSGRIAQQPPRVETGDPDFSREIGQCRYAYPVAGTTPSYPVALHPLQRLQGRYKILFKTYPNGADHDRLVGLLVALH